MTTKTSISKPGHSFFQLASFGKRMEFSIIADMLREGLDIYRPLVDDKGIDCILRRENGTFAEIQIMARSNQIGYQTAATFAGLRCVPRRDSWFVFHAALLGENGLMWIMNSLELEKYASCNTSGKHIGTYTIHLHKSKKENGKTRLYPNPLLEKFIVTNFDRILDDRLLDDDLLCKESLPAMELI